TCALPICATAPWSRPSALPPCATARVTTPRSRPGCRGRWGVAMRRCGRCCSSASPSSIRCSCRRMRRWRRRSTRCARWAAATRPDWRTHCCAARSAMACRPATRKRRGRRGCASACAGPTWLRVNRARGSVQDYAVRLEEAGIAPALADGLPDAIRLDATVSPTTLPGFAAGDVSVQDAAAQRVADALSPPRGGRVLDACAAPGGKSAHLLERDPSLRLTALDVDARRLRRVHDTLARLGVGADARLLAADAADPAAWWDGEPFDAILLDAPCSGTGIARRQPDVLLHRRVSDLVALTALQARLLDALWPLLPPCGRLVYTTCSILRAENADQIAALLARTPDARAMALDASYGHA